MQMLYLLPPALLLWRSFGERRRRARAAGAGAGDGGGAARRRPRLAGDLGRGRARPRRHRADCRRAAILRAKVEAVHRRHRAGVRAARRRRSRSPRRGTRSSPALGIVVAAASATAIQLWFRTQAKRSQFRRRQTSSRVATFAEAFSSIGWAGAAAVAAVSLPLAVIPACSRSPCSAAPAL